MRRRGDVRGVGAAGGSPTHMDLQRIVGAIHAPVPSVSSERQRVVGGDVRTDRHRVCAAQLTRFVLSQPEGAAASPRRVGGLRGSQAALDPDVSKCKGWLEKDSKVTTLSPQQPLRRIRLSWPGRKPAAVGWRALRWVAVAGVVALLTGTLFALLSWIFGGQGGWFGADRGCNRNQFSCGVVVEIVPTVLALAASFALFVYWRVRRVTRTHLRNAFEDPWKLVPTATEMKVVGRDEICKIIESDLHYSSGRRAQLIVGGIGEGKTAVLVRLAEELARRGAVPVAVRLADATDTLDFSELAKRQFIDRVNQSLLTDDEGDKVWRRLCRDDRIVVLADGLEEALRGQPDRVAIIKRALAEAEREDLPLVITSRPDEALRGLNAALIRLEPLPEQEIVEYLCAEGGRDRGWIGELAGVAQLSESPLYLKLAEGLDHDARDGVPLASGRIAARVALLKRWRSTLAESSTGGHVHEPEDREEALVRLERIACLALRAGKLEVEENESENTTLVPPSSSPHVTFRLVANVGDDLGVVDRRGRNVRFRHGITQAYLGARALPSVIDAPANGDYLDDGVLQSSHKELLIALVIASYCNEVTGLRCRLRARLLQAAASDRPNDRFGLLASAWEIAAMTEGTDTEVLARATEDAWADDAKVDRRRRADVLRVTESKLVAITRMAEVPRTETFLALWKIAQSRDTYGVRLRAAQALGSGGELAYGAIRDEINNILADVRSSPLADRWRRAERREVRRWSLLGWILPSLWASCASSSEAAEHVRQCLKAWVKIASTDFHLGAQACLAQGFKYEANRRPLTKSSRLGASPDSEFLIELCETLLARSDWWYTQISLLQALALCSLDSDSACRARLAGGMSDWKQHAGHPYVREVARLCRDAIDTGRKAATPDDARPGRFIWIDETGVALKIGSQSAVSGGVGTSGLWISPAAGWHTLKESARQLVGEILVYLNLIEVGEERTDGPVAANDAQRREHRRRAVLAKGAWLPPCMIRAGHGGLLATDDDPCDCGVHLCPYPRRGETPFRGELGETFCRHQKRLLTDRAGGVPSWHERPLYSTVRRRSTIKDFWTEMENRARQLSDRWMLSGLD
jgi:hypothetical protein